MLDLLLARFRQKHRTISFPNGPPPALPERFRGHPVIHAERCEPGCSECADACPTGAIRWEPSEPSLEVDLGRCLFCAECAQACPNGAISYGSDYRLAARTRQDLVALEGNPVRLAAALEEKARKLFGRSLKLRQVSAGGCNGCESEVNVLSTLVWDIGRFGIQIVASPRHADGLIVTGPVTVNMRLALEKTYAAVAPPKIVIAVGACAISGGPYVDHPEAHDGADSVVPVDLYVPGCPPHPLTLLDGLLRLLGRIEAEPGARGL
ncbi:MAG TPA: NADH-quinone oxidoreductase subunit NuoB [Thermoanaerobaculia bacterium]|nr:NADH-quinone oxidoreductase subunit NuoB [Thermoanaerobaculia bacterium]